MAVIRKFYFWAALIAPLLVFLWVSLLPSIDGKISRKNLEAILRSDLRGMRTAIVEYRNAQGEYPRSLQDLVEKGDLRHIPIEPITRRYDSWILVKNGQGRIVSIHSGSNDRALDGSLYKLW